MKNPDRTISTTGVLNQKPHADSIRPAQKTGTFTAGEIAVITTRDEPHIDSRLLAKHLGNQHRHAVRLIERHRERFERFGVLRFQNAKPAGSKGGRPEKFTLLNENQSFLLVALADNTEHALDLKERLIRAFSEARRAAEQHRAEYSPTYHALHDEIKMLAAGSPNERWAHANVNKLLNKIAGIESGQRQNAGLPQQSLLTVAQAVAAKAMQGAADHRDGYRRAKEAMVALSAATMLDGGDRAVLIGGAQ